MKLWIFTLFLALSIVGNTLSAKDSSNHLSPPPHLTFSTERMPPFADTATLDGGILPLLVKTIFRKKGITVQIQQYHLDAWRKDFSEKKAVGHFPAYFAPGAQDPTLLRSPVMHASFYIYTLRSNKLARKITGNTRQKETKKVLCIPQKLFRIPGLEEAIQKKNVPYISALTTNGCKLTLIDGRAQGFVDEELHALSIGLQKDAQDLIALKKSEKPFFTTPVYVIFSKDVPGIEHVKDFFDQALAEAQKDGTFSDILKRFYNYWTIIH